VELGVRTARLVCEEKGAEYELVDVAMLKGEHREPAHLKRHPFGMLPSWAERAAFPRVQSGQNYNLTRY
jgi:glutathione S-transferase